MTVAKTKNKIRVCPKCHGRNYVLKNVKGKVRANICNCYNCGQCGGEGRIYVEDERGISSVKDCECAVLGKKLKRIEDVGIPGKYVRADIGSWFAFDPQEMTQKTALSRSESFVKDFGKSNKGLVFMGGPGVGKTHLAVSIIKALSMEKGIDCKFVDFFQLLSDIRYGFSEGMSEQALINPYVKSHVLVIDELAKGRNTEWELTILDQIISQRYNDADKVTIFTTNYLNGPEEENPGNSKTRSTESHVDTNSMEHLKNLRGKETLQEKIGSRIYSRLVEVCDFILIEGPDYRQKKHGSSFTQGQVEYKKILDRKTTGG